MNNFPVSHFRPANHLSADSHTYNKGERQVFVTYFGEKRWVSVENVKSGKAGEIYIPFENWTNGVFDRLADTAAETAAKKTRKTLAHGVLDKREALKIDARDKRLAFLAVEIEAKRKMRQDAADLRKTGLDKLRAASMKRIDDRIVAMRLKREDKIAAKIKAKLEKKQAKIKVQVDAKQAKIKARLDAEQAKVKSIASPVGFEDVLEYLTGMFPEYVVRVEFSLR